VSWWVSCYLYVRCSVWLLVWMSTQLPAFRVICTSDALCGSSYVCQHNFQLFVLSVRQMLCVALPMDVNTTSSFSCYLYVRCSVWLFLCMSTQLPAFRRTQMRTSLKILDFTPISRHRSILVAVTILNHCSARNRSLYLGVTIAENTEDWGQVIV
jgi:hypothetical protein